VHEPVLQSCISWSSSAWRRSGRPDLQRVREHTYATAVTEAVDSCACRHDTRTRTRPRGNPTISCQHKQHSTLAVVRRLIPICLDEWTDEVQKAVFIDTEVRVRIFAVRHECQTCLRTP